MADKYIGLMSGTSADSIDVVLVNITQNSISLINRYSHPIPNTIQTQIWSMNHSNDQRLNTMLQLDYQLGVLYSEAINNLLNQTSLNKDEIIAIGCHGQTIYHQPNSKYPSTLQIGNASIIVEKTGINTVTDFRRADIAAGGQGAPLASSFHQHFFRSANINRVILNIGGIANISYLPAAPEHAICGFDTGPGNALMDEWCQKYNNMSYDQNGEWAASGEINATLLTQLLEHKFFTKPTPKSTGRDEFNFMWIQSIMKQYHQSIPEELKKNDVQATLTALTAHSIYNAIHSLENVDELYVCGGGILNLTLYSMLKKLVNTDNISIHSTSELSIDPQWVEACAFAWLAQQRINEIPANCPEVTGARHQCVLGALYFSNKDI